MVQKVFCHCAKIEKLENNSLNAQGKLLFKLKLSSNNRNNK